MNLEEAISRKEYLFDLNRSHTPFEDREADALSIEALKRLREYRRPYTVTEIVLLPGETV